jgi:hypothetical protein
VTSVAELERASGSRRPLARCIGDAERFLRETWGRALWSTRVKTRSGSPTC